MEKYDLNSELKKYFPEIEKPVEKVKAVEDKKEIKKEIPKKTK